MTSYYLRFDMFVSCIHNLRLLFVAAITLFLILIFFFVLRNRTCVSYIGCEQFLNLGSADNSCVKHQLGHVPLSRSQRHDEPAINIRNNVFTNLCVLITFSFQNKITVCEPMRFCAIYYEAVSKRSDFSWQNHPVIQIVFYFVTYCNLFTLRLNYG